MHAKERLNSTDEILSDKIVKQSIQSTSQKKKTICIIRKYNNSDNYRGKGLK
jgi:hypothetical protein